jgi:GTP-binding protein Era
MNLLARTFRAGPQYYPEEQQVIRAIEQLICEFIREAAWQDVREEASALDRCDNWMEFGRARGKGFTPIL